MYLIDLEFRARRRIATLPQWHGARWSAWLRFASKAAGYSLDSIVSQILAFRNGLEPIVPGERLVLRIGVPAEGDAISALPDLLSALAHYSGEGQFTADSLELAGARDVLSARILWENGYPCPILPVRFSERFVLPEISALLALPDWSIQFHAPLRLPLPQGHPERGDGQAKYSGPEHLVARGGLDNLLARIRFPCKETSLPPLRLALNASWLRWDDMRYNESRKIALGGIVGVVSLRGKLEREHARRLVLGQYFGAGKNSRFGLGFWRIPELAGWRILTV